MDIAASLSKAVVLPIGDTTMNVSIHEDNSGALVLAGTIPPQFTQRSKKFAIKMNWVCGEIMQRSNNSLKVDMVKKHGGLFMK